MNPANFITIANAKNQFEQTHPKFHSFLNNLIRRGVEAGSIIEITVTRPDGTRATGNMRVQQSDIELVEQLKELRP